MKALITMFLATILTISLSACGCSNNSAGDTQIPSTTLIPDILPTIETNIPDPEVDTQMPMYTDGTDSTAQTDFTIPSGTDKEINK